MMSWTLKRVLVAIGVALSFGCEMQDNMSKMLDNTEALGRKTTHMEDSMEDVKQGGREHIAGQMIPLSMKNMRNQPWIHDKLIEAAHYVYSFEFQHWGSLWGDTQEVREMLFEKALETLFVHTYDLFNYANRAPLNYSFTVNLTLPPNNAWKTLGVLSYMIGRNDPNHLVVARERKFKAISFYDLISEGLRMKLRPTPGEKVPAWASMVGKYQKRALQFLQLRHNFLPMMVLGRVDDFDKNPRAQLRMRFSRWNFPLDSFSDDQLQEMMSELSGAQETRDFLKGSLGQEIEWFEFMRAIYRNVIFVSEKNPEAAQILNYQVSGRGPYGRGSREALAVELRDLWATVAKPVDPRTIPYVVAPETLDFIPAYDGSRAR